jgi:predicted CoA-binding protein
MLTRPRRAHNSLETTRSASRVGLMRLVGRGRGAPSPERWRRSRQAGGSRRLLPDPPYPTGARVCTGYCGRVPTDSPTDPATDWQDPAAVALMLDDCETWAVVGLTTNTDRTAYSIAALLQRRGKRIVPINPAADDVLGETGYARLADVPFPVDVVDVFRRSEAAGEFADQAVAIGARGVWFQLGVVDEAAFARTRAAGVAMVMDTCPAIEWRKR